MYDHHSMPLSVFLEKSKWCRKYYKQREKRKSRMEFSWRWKIKNLKEQVFGEGNRLTEGFSSNCSNFPHHLLFCLIHSSDFPSILIQNFILMMISSLWFQSPRGTSAAATLFFDIHFSHWRRELVLWSQVTKSSSSASVNWNLLASAFPCSIFLQCCWNIIVKVGLPLTMRSHFLFSVISHNCQNSSLWGSVVSVVMVLYSSHLNSVFFILCEYDLEPTVYRKQPRVEPSGRKSFIWTLFDEKLHYMYKVNFFLCIYI